jgi:hypothetical protein
VKPRKKQMKPHKHAEIIKAWAEGAEIEAQGSLGHWYAILEPRWHADVDYRIKPTPKPGVVEYLQVSLGRHSLYPHPECGKRDNLKLTFDGETHKLKSAEVI